MGKRRPAASAPALSPLERFVFGPVLELRLALLRRLFLLLLAFDLWLEFAEHGGRYGIGGFNVAHFAWLDALMPLPTPGLYVASVCLAGCLALLSALLPLPRWVGVLLALVYTYTWAMSMLDSYQHHYLLSLMLAFLAFFPQPPFEEAKANEEIESATLGRSISAWAYVGLLLQTAIVYGYTMVAKLDPLWREGQVLRRIAGSHEPFRALASLWAGAGLSPTTFWSLLSLGVAGLQALLALAYALAAFRDRAGGETWAPVYAAGWAGAFAFHLGIELSDFEIGWFSYYMLTLATIVFAPARWLQAACALSLHAWHKASASMKALHSSQARPSLKPALVWLLGASPSLLLLYGVAQSDLPGLPALALILAPATLVLLLFLARTGRTSLWQGALALTLTFGALLCALRLSEVRFDYYRFVGSEAKRRGDLGEALIAYRKANLYAPTDKNRKREEQEVRNALHARP